MNQEPQVVMEAINDAPGRASRGLWPIDWFLIALVGLLIQSVWLLVLKEPSYMDGYYYTTNGQRLADGYGFSELVIWEYLDDPVSFPTPSHTYWMPLPSILAAGGYSILGNFTGSQLFFWILGGLTPLLAYAISHQLNGQRWQGWVAAMFTAAAGYYSPYLSQPTTFAPFAWAGGLGLLAIGLATVFAKPNETESVRPKMNISWRRIGWWLAAGVLAGLAHLTRADGVLLLGVGLIICLLELRSSESRRQVWFGLGSLLLGYLLIMGWWFGRNWLVIGRPLSTVSAQTMFLTNYDDIFAYGRTITAANFFDWGLANIAKSRLDSLWVAVQTMIAIPGLIFLVPFILIAAIRYRRDRYRWLLLRPVFLFAAILLAVLVILFTFPGMRGSLFHSSIALFPWTMALAPAGIGFAVDWAASHLSHWRPERAKRIFSALFVGVAFMITLAVAPRSLGDDVDGEIYHQIADRLSPYAVVMAGDAPKFYFHTSLASLSVPNEPLSIVLDAARRYGVTHLVLDENHPKPLTDLYQASGSRPGVRLLDTYGDIKLYEILPRE